MASTFACGSVCVSRFLAASTRLLAAPVEDDCSACFCKPARDGKANARGRAGDDGPFSVKLDLHGSVPKCD